MTAALHAFHFLRPWALLAILPAFPIWLMLRRANNTTGCWRRVIDPVLLKALTVEGERSGTVSPADAALALWIVAALAVSGPTWRREPPPFADSESPAMIVLRVTPSMTNSDLEPSRLERARQKISDLLDLREGAATGLIAYSGSAHLVLPPTSDNSVLMTMVAALSPAIMPRQGDRTVEAVDLAARTLADGKAGGAVLLIADTVSPDQAGRLAQDALKERPPVTLLAMAPAERIEADPSLDIFAKALGARLIETTADRNDVRTVAARLQGSAWSGEVAGEGAQWRDEGYWLTPLVALVSLGWFRRGWVLGR
jgi:Ca-activated chloride channel family protein